MVQITGKRKDDPKHYHPISLLKIFEKLLLPKLLEFLEHHNLDLRHHILAPKSYTVFV